MPILPCSSLLRSHTVAGPRQPDASLFSGCLQYSTVSPTLNSNSWCATRVGVWSARFMRSRAVPSTIAWIAISRSRCTYELLLDLKLNRLERLGLPAGLVESVQAQQCMDCIHWLRSRHSKQTRLQRVSFGVGQPNPLQTAGSLSYEECHATLGFYGHKYAHADLRLQCAWWFLLARSTALIDHRPNLILHRKSTLAWVQTCRSTGKVLWGWTAWSYQELPMLMPIWHHDQLDAKLPVENHDDDRTLNHLRLQHWNLLPTYLMGYYQFLAYSTGDKHGRCLQCQG